MAWWWWHTTSAIWAALAAIAIRVKCSGWFWFPNEICWIKLSKIADLIFVNSEEEILIKRTVQPASHHFISVVRCHRFYISVFGSHTFIVATKPNQTKPMRNEPTSLQQRPAYRESSLAPASPFNMVMMAGIQWLFGVSWQSHANPVWFSFVCLHIAIR